MQAEPVKYIFKRADNGVCGGESIEWECRFVSFLVDGDKVMSSERRLVMLLDTFPVIHQCLCFFSSVNMYLFKSEHNMLME